MQSPPQLFETKTGRFTPLPDDQLAALTQPQAEAYMEVAASVAALAEVDAEFEPAKADTSACVAALAEAERATPRYDASAAHTRLVKEMIASNRRS